MFFMVFFAIAVSPNVTIYQKIPAKISWAKSLFKKDFMGQVPYFLSFKSSWKSFQYTLYTSLWQCSEVNLFRYLSCLDLGFVLWCNSYLHFSKIFYLVWNHSWSSISNLYEPEQHQNQGLISFSQLMSGLCWWHQIFLHVHWHMEGNHSCFEKRYYATQHRKD